MPLTDYNRYKGLCEPFLLKHQSPGFTTRDHPAGHGLRLLAAHALRSHGQHPHQPRRQRGLITVFGGAQKRPNIHIDDVSDLYVRHVWSTRSP